MKFLNLKIQNKLTKNQVLDNNRITIINDNIRGGVFFKINDSGVENINL